MKESKIQIECVKWFRLAYPTTMLFSIPNGGFRTIRNAKIIKAEGVVAGVADLFLAMPNKDFHGLFIEMKTDKGRQQLTQKMFETNVKANGYNYQIVRSFDEFQELVNSYLNLR